MAGLANANIFGLEPFVIFVARTTLSMAHVLEHHRTQIINYVVATNTNLVKLNIWEADVI